MDVQEIWLRLSRLQKVSLPQCLAIAQHCSEGKPNVLLLRKLGLTQTQAQKFLAAEHIEADLRWLSQQENALIACDDPRYPEKLKNIANPPPVLFVKGNVECLSLVQIAIVGSRRYSDYGETCATYFSSELSAAGLVITSGLALGIDGIAHRACLETQGTTIAVLGCGIAQLYPACHEHLASRIVANHGAIVSEFPPSTKARAEYFPRRNRIISGLSEGVLIVEAAEKSGTLITARCALEQGKDVFAIPGSIESLQSAGSNWLIQQGAYLVSHPKDIIEQIGGLHWLPSPSPEIIYPEQDVAELPFAEVLANVEYEVTSVDVVAERVGQPVPEIAVALLDLELAGWIKAVSGGYVRLKRASHVRRINVPV
ncbi:MAG: DNA-protecting protein DprA [Enterobacterales bacterium]|nr:DNA-protecting protein DprA [Enterobacterales bacterium]